MSKLKQYTSFEALKADTQKSIDSPSKTVEENHKAFEVLMQELRKKYIEQQMAKK